MKRPVILFLADHRYRVYAGEGGNVHLEGMRRAFAEFGEVREPAAPLSVPLMRWASRHGRPAGWRKWVERLGQVLSYPEKVWAVLAWRPALLYVRHEVTEVPMLSLLRALRRIGLARPPVALEVNAIICDETPVAERGDRWAGRRRFEVRGFFLADHLYAVSGYLRDALVAEGVAEDRVAVTHNGVEPGDFPEPGGSAGRDGGGAAEGVVADGGREAEGGADRGRAAGAASVRPFTVGFLGTGHRWHGQTALVQAFARLRASVPSARLLVVGPPAPDLPAALEAAVAADPGLAEAVEVTGTLPRGEALRRAREFDVAALPSNLPHGSSLKIFEYMALAKAIVAPATPALSEVLQDGRTALLIPPGDVEWLAAALARLAGDPGLRARLGKAAREDVLARFTWRANAVAVLRDCAPELLPLAAMGEAAGRV